MKIVSLSWRDSSTALLIEPPVNLSALLLDYDAVWKICPSVILSHGGYIVDT